MGKESAIEWTDHTWNPWRGCAHAVLANGTPHPGCTHCYAERQSRRNPVVLGVWGPEYDGGTRVMAAPQTFAAPRAWNKQAEAAGERQRVFLDSMHDLFEDWHGPIHDHRGDVFVRPYLDSESNLETWRSADPERHACDPQGWVTLRMDDVRREVFRVIDQCPWLDFLVLTKRPGNILRMTPEVDVRSQQQADSVNERGTMYRPHVWLGTSISDQPTANALVPQLLKSRDLSPVLFLSAEPLVGPIDLQDIPDGDSFLDALASNRAWIDWVIVGGESGNQPTVRPMHPQWARDLRDQCVRASVPFFFKQWGEWRPEEVPGTEADLEQLAANQQVAYGNGRTNHVRFTRVGKKAAGRLLDGREWSQLPLSLTPHP